MFFEKMRRFFSIFPVISASKPMKMAKIEFRVNSTAALQMLLRYIYKEYKFRYSHRNADLFKA